jgi:hypothetical protein
MTAIAQGEAPHVGIFWVVQTTDGNARLLAAGCPLDQAEPYGDCLTYGPGHYETWAHWRRDRQVDPALRKYLDNRLVPLHKDYDSFVGCALMLAGSG